ncbi:MAG: hypothetical protein U1A78_18115 [Polyangia bacterium]
MLRFPRSVVGLAAALLITLPGPRPPRAGLPPDALADAPADAPAVSATAPATPPGPSEPAAPPSPPAEVPAGCGAEDADGALDLDAGPLGAKQKVARTNVMNARFDGGFGFYALRAKADPGPASDGPLRLTLSGPERLKKDQPLRLTLRFRNPTVRPITILRPNDGSLEHMREPHYDLFLRDEGSGRVYRYAFVGGRCGNVNPTRPEDHVELAPGSERGDVVNGWADYLSSARIGAPGRYRLWLRYRFCSYQGRGLPLGKDVRRSDTFRGVAVSSPVFVEVR